MIKILCYHGVIKNNNSKGVVNYNSKHISEKNFEKQMIFLKKNQNVISLKDFLRLKKRKKNLTIITFDDGFKNNYLSAYKILKKYNLPATFFICPGLINKKKLFWVDQIETFFHFTKKKFFDFYLEDKENFDISNLRKKILVCEKIKNFCKNINNTEKNKLVYKLKKSLLIIKPKKIRRFHDTLTWSQIKKMNKNNLFDFGIHSWNHEIYSRLTIKDQNSNIKKSIKCLSNILNEKIYLSSYPEGKKTDFNKETVSIMKRHGIKVCPMAIPGVNTYSSNKFYLKRYMVGFQDRKFPYRAYYNKK